MKKEEPPALTRVQQLQLDDALAALLASTRRSRRSLNLVEVSEKLRTALRLLGSIGAVADALGLSDETVRQFSRVEKLAPEVKRLLSNGRITSMDLADRISRLPTPDQPPIARAVASGTLDADDVRAILAFRKTAPDIPIQQAIQRIRNSRNVKEYVAEFVIPLQSGSPAIFLKRLSPVISRREIRDLQMGKNGVGRLFLTAGGKKALEDRARNQGVTKRELLQCLIEGGPKQRAR